jgi:hypothetical protein
MTDYTIIPADQYAAHPGITKSAICAAMIDQGTVSMAHMRAEMLRDRADAGTKAMQAGTLAHMALLEPGAMLSRCALWEGESKRGKEWTAFKEENEGRLIVTLADIARVTDMSTALRAHPLARGLVGRIEHAERAIGWEDPLYGAAKGRPDGCGAGLLIEYKTARKISRQWFLSDAWQRGYQFGVAWYWHGLGRPQDAWIIHQESGAPYTAACYRLAPGPLERWYDEAAGIASAYRAHESHSGVPGGRWPGPYEDELAFEAPGWAGGGDIEDDEDNDEMEG